VQLADGEPADEAGEGDADTGHGEPRPRPAVSGRGIGSHSDLSIAGMKIEYAAER